MPLTYQITTFKMRFNVVRETAIFLGAVTVEVTAPGDQITLDRLPPDVVIRDLSTRARIDPIDALRAVITFTAPGGGGAQSGTHLFVTALPPGAVESQGLLDAWLVRIDGAAVPRPRVGADLNRFFEQIDLDLEIEDAPLPPGTLLDLDTLDDVLSVTGRADTPKAVAPEPSPQPDPDQPAAQTLITRGAADDRIDGPADNTRILAGAGDDRVVDRAGANQILGMAGDDTILAGDGQDRIDGGSGDDVLSGGGGDDFIDGGAGDDRLSGGPGADGLLGGDGADVIRTGGGGGIASGGDGADILLGFSGDETLLGGLGDDVLSGSTGADTLGGGGGDDRLTGGPGRDVFQLRADFGADRVLDFTDRSDLLDFAGHAGVRDLGDLTLQAVGGAVVIGDATGNRLVLVGVALAQIDADDFLF